MGGGASGRSPPITGAVGSIPVPELELGVLGYKLGFGYPPIGLLVGVLPIEGGAIIKGGGPVGVFELTEGGPRLRLAMLGVLALGGRTGGGALGSEVGGKLAGVGGGAKTEDVVGVKVGGALGGSFGLILVAGPVIPEPMGVGGGIRMGVEDCWRLDIMTSWFTTLFRTGGRELVSR